MLFISVCFFAIAFAIPTKLKKANALEQLKRDTETSLANENQALKEANVDLMHQIEQKVGDDYCETGMLQSPIDLPQSWSLSKRKYKLLVEEIQGPQEVKWGKLDDGYGRMGWKLTHGTVQRKLQSGYGPLYKMQSFTIVAPGEHTMEHDKFDAELQIFFKSVDNTYETLRMSILLILGHIPRGTEEMNRFWSPLMQSLSPVAGNRKYTISLEYLFNQLTLDEYYRYHGSETSGGCEENIEWIVMGNILKIDNLLYHFLEQKGDRPIPRKTQDLWGRHLEVGSERPLLWPEASVRESYSGAYSVFGQGKGVVISSFAFIGAISLIWYGSRAFHKACVSSEFTPIQEAEY